MHYVGFAHLVAAGIVASVFVNPTSVSARRAHVDACASVTGSGSVLSATSPVSGIDREHGTPATLAAFCGTPAAKIDERLSVLGRNGTSYNLKLVFSQAEALVDVEAAASRPPPHLVRAAPHAEPAVTWENDLEQQFAYLRTLASTGKSPCPNGDDACLDFASALANDAGTPALGPSTLSFPIGDFRHGHDGKPFIGAVISSVLTPHLAVPTASPVASIDASSLRNEATVASSATVATTAPPSSSAFDARTGSGGVTVSSSSVATAAAVSGGGAVKASLTGVTETSTLTLFIGNTPYTIVTFAQNLGLLAPLTYTVDGRLGLGAPATCPATKAPSQSAGNVQDFCTTFTGSDLAFRQRTALGGDLPFCPKPSLPIPGVGGIVLLTAGCHGAATLAYDVNVAAQAGYGRIVPAFDLHITGSLKANAVVISGQVDADLTVAKIDGTAGFMYGTFSDPFHRAAPTLAFRSFAYYDATALPLDLTLSVRTFWGYRRHVTFHLYPGFSTSSPVLDRHAWSIERL